MKARPSRSRRPPFLAWVGIPAVFGIGALAGLAFGLSTWRTPSVDPSLVMAEVHGEAITWQQIADRLEGAAVMGKPQPDDRAGWQLAVRGAVDSAINDVLARHFVEGNGITVTDAQVDEAVNDLRTQYGGEAALAAAMADMHLTLAEVRETQRRGLYYQALIDLVVPVSNADIDAYLAEPGAAGLSRAAAAARVRADRAPSIVPDFLAQWRAEPGIWTLPLDGLE